MVGSAGSKGSVGVIGSGDAGRRRPLVDWIRVGVRDFWQSLVQEFWAS